MNILLIQPFFKKSEKAYPLGLGYISSVLKQRGHNVFGADLSFYHPGEILDLIKKENINLVGISAMSYNFSNAVHICKNIKSRYAVPIVVGGPHATIFKERLLRNYGGYFDYLVAGEGEWAFAELTDCLQKGVPPAHVDGLSYISNGEIFINKKRKEEPDINNFPFPDRNIFPIYKYRGMFAREKLYTQIITSRGCDHRCNYCPESALSNGWRGRLIENVIAEIESIVASFGIKEFHIEDANFLGGGAKRIEELCKRIIALKLNIKWQCPNGIPAMDFKDDSILGLMAEAGCYSISLGIESLEEGILNSMGRLYNFNSVKKIVKSAHKAGIEVTGYFMIGFPGQSLKSIKNDASLSRRLGFDFLHYSIFQLIPGSSLFYSYSDSLDIEYTIKQYAILPGINKRSLGRLRILFSLSGFLSPRYFLFIFSLIIRNNPYRILRRAAVHLLGLDLKF
ncbi:MAG: radical SAM protein [Candidatus Omnitrophota bacterium]